jgi:hypothetical protein
VAIFLIFAIKPFCFIGVLETLSIPLYIFSIPIAMANIAMDACTYVFLFIVCFLSLLLVYWLHGSSIVYAVVHKSGLFCMFVWFVCVGPTVAANYPTHCYSSVSC